MLLCPTHHKLVDVNPDAYSVETLREYKEIHERRIEYLTGFDENLKTHLVFFKDNIGERLPAITFNQALQAVLPRYPSENEAGTIQINLANGAFRDHEPGYFASKQEEINRLVDARLRQRHDIDQIGHFSIFALASMPLLIHFGQTVGDTMPSDVYQYHRNTASWVWQSPKEDDPLYIVEEPDDPGAKEYSTVVLNLSLSGTILADDIASAMTAPYCTYKITLPLPERDYLKSKEQLIQFGVQMRTLFARIREVHGARAEIHLFPAIPASVAVKLGKLLLPKVDPPIHVYEYHQQQGGFNYALTVLKM